MEYINQKYFSQLQKTIVQQKVDGMSYKKIVSVYYEKNSAHDTISKEAIKTCLKRSALSLNWDKGTICGRLPTISDVDIDELKQFISENSVDGEYLDVDAALEKAEELRKERLENAESFLVKIKCFGIIEEIHNQIGDCETTRTWIYDHINELDAQLSSPRTIVLNRLIACTPDKITDYTKKLFPILEPIHPCLRFCADETMLQPNVQKKVLVPNGQDRPIVSDEIQYPHITGMCCCNCVGQKMPLFIIPPNLKKLPEDLKEFAETGQAYFASSQSGWQTRDTFLWFVIIFINWLSTYRLQLNKVIRDFPAILIVDGHKSRECPIAIKLLKDHNIDLFVIPAHTSHVTQLFDVGIGSSMKYTFTKFFKKEMVNFNPEINNLGQYRYFCTVSAISAWDSQATYKSCKHTAMAIGICPCSAEPLLKNIFVKELPPQIQQIAQEREMKKKSEQININCKLISDKEQINEINEYIKQSLYHQHLSLENFVDNYLNNIQMICATSHNNCHIFGPIPCFYDLKNQQMHFFDDAI